jgi:hypothetical protein
VRREAVKMRGGMRTQLEDLLFFRVVSFSHLLSKRDVVEGEPVGCWSHS